MVVLQAVEIIIVITPTGYSMWQSEEPRNNSVGYSSKNGVPVRKKQHKYKQKPHLMKMLQAIIMLPHYNQPSYNNSSNVDLSQQQQISAQLISQGNFQEGKNLIICIKRSNHN